MSSIPIFIPLNPTFNKIICTNMTVESINTTSGDSVSLSITSGSTNLNNVIINDTTESTSANTGSVIISGGVGIMENCYVSGGNIPNFVDINIMDPARLAFILPQGNLGWNHLYSGFQSSFRWYYMPFTHCLQNKSWLHAQLSTYMFYASDIPDPGPVYCNEPIQVANQSYAYFKLDPGTYHIRAMYSHRLIGDSSMRLLANGSPILYADVAMFGGEDTYWIHEAGNYFVIDNYFTVSDGNAEYRLEIWSEIFSGFIFGGPQDIPGRQEYYGFVHLWKIA